MTEHGSSGGMSPIPTAGAFADTLTSVLAAASDDGGQLAPETFAASQLGFCPRGAYTATLGVRDTAALQGRLIAGRKIQTVIEERLAEACPHLEVGPTSSVDVDAVRIVGRPTCYDPDTRTVYHVKPRAGWYEFHPPNERHVNQLQAYIHGLDAERGQLVYVSMTDLLDVRTWPPDGGSEEHDRQGEPTADSAFIEPDRERLDRLLAKAERIRDEIVTNGFPTAPSEIPFPKCGCYLCTSEELQLPEPTVARADASELLKGDHMPCDDLSDCNHDTDADAPSAGTTASQRGEGSKPMAGDGEPEIDTGPEIQSDPASARPNPVEGSAVAEALPALRDLDPVVLDSDTDHIPADLRSLDMWVLWDGREKRPLAPWQTGTMYPCEWAASKDVDPRRPYEKARMVSELPVKQIHDAWPFPDASDLPEQVHPAVLLPHEPPDPPVVFIDLDDVRDPATGEVPGEVHGMLDALGGYAEISRSGRGLHAFVRGRLPETVGRVAAPLRTHGRLEMYDRARFAGGTWQHVAGTPLDAVPHAQAVIDALVAAYVPPARGR